MSYGRSCIGEVHVFRMAYLTICCFTERCLNGGHVYLRVGIVGGHVLLLKMSYWGMVVMYFMRICVMGGQV